MNKGCTMNNHLDEKDKEILNKRQELMNTIKVPKVGDYVYVPSKEGTYRITNVVEDRIQITCYKINNLTDTSPMFYLTKEGYCSFSGSLDSIEGEYELVNKKVTRLGSVWFFHHDFWRAHNGVETQVKFRCWEVVFKK